MGSRGFHYDVQFAATVVFQNSPKLHETHCILLSLGVSALTSLSQKLTRCRRARPHREDPPRSLPSNQVRTRPARPRRRLRLRHSTSTRENGFRGEPWACATRAVHGASLDAEQNVPRSGCRLRQHEGRPTEKSTSTSYKDGRGEHRDGPAQRVGVRVGKVPCKVPRGARGVGL